MGEYVWTISTIGGKLPRNRVEEFEAIVDFSNGDCDDIEGAIADRRSFTTQGKDGNPDDLEAFCREHGLAFNISYASKGSLFDSGLKYWFPDMKEPIEVGVDDHGDPIVSIDDLRLEAKKGRTLAEILTAYDRAEPSKIPPLEWGDAIPNPAPGADAWKAWIANIAEKAPGDRTDEESEALCAAVAGLKVEG